MYSIHYWAKFRELNILCVKCAQMVDFPKFGHILVSQVQTALPFCHWFQRDLVQFKFHTRLNKLGSLKKTWCIFKKQHLCLLITTVNQLFSITKHLLFNRYAEPINIVSTWAVYLWCSSVTCEDNCGIWIVPDPFFSLPNV